MCDFGGGGIFARSIDLASITSLSLALAYRRPLHGWPGLEGGGGGGEEYCFKGIIGGGVGAVVLMERRNGVRIVGTV